MILFFDERDTSVSPADDEARPFLDRLRAASEGLRSLNEAMRRLGQAEADALTSRDEPGGADTAPLAP